MKIREMDLPVGELVKAYYEDNTTSKVTAWGGKLDVRPEYQREYVYDEKERDAVINTVLKGFPLNIMYFVERPDGTFEVLDGQQRIISLCRYAANMFSVKIPSVSGGYNTVNYPNLFDEQAKIFNEYKLKVYICEGTDKEKTEWFQIINIAGEKLEKQEILNAVYHCKWLTDAKSAFSRRNCAAYKNYGKYMAGDYIRQKFLETAFSWAADAEGITGKDAVEAYMQKHRQDDNANDLWKYFEDVFEWVKKIFGKKVLPSMKGVKWGILYNEHKDDNIDPQAIQDEMEALLKNENNEIGRMQGIYEYLLSKRTVDDEKVLSLRQFSMEDRLTMYARQLNKCAICQKTFDIKDMHADHVIPWSRGGKTTLDNGQMLCTTCNLKKSNNL